MTMDCQDNRTSRRLARCHPRSSILFLLAVLVSRVAPFSYNDFGSLLKEDLLTTNSVNDDKSSPIQKGYWCDHCSCGFNKHRSLLEHQAGKKHNAAIAEGDIVWQEYIESAHKKYKSNDGSPVDSPFFHESVTKMDVAKTWSLDAFMEGLRARSKSSKKKSVAKDMVGLVSHYSSYAQFTGNNANAGGGNQIDPTLRLSDLSPSKKAALFRYLHVTSSQIPGLIDMVSVLPSRYVRVKELLESIEVYFRVVNTILRRKQPNPKRLARVYDIGCGHGLVGMLIAASYPNIEVHSIDLVPRESYVAQREAFVSAGISLDNLMFEAGDLSVVARAEDKIEESCGHTLMLCVHGCKELTHESIEVAKDQDWAWLAVPCCLQTSDHLTESTTLKIQSDHTRYAILCGAIASNYNADYVTTIDSRITGRGIVLASFGATNEREVS